MQIQFGAIIVAVLLAVAHPAHAATDSRYQTAQGGVSCKPTDMVVNTGIKAKSTGLRNEGTVSTFVICGFESSNSRADYGTIQSFTIALFALNNASTTVNCTAVNGMPDSPPVYATKNLATRANGTAATMSFDASDFGGTAGDSLPASDYWSVTCNLPAKTSVGYMTTKFIVNVASP